MGPQLITDGSCHLSVLAALECLFVLEVDALDFRELMHLRQHIRRLVEKFFRIEK